MGRKSGRVAVVDALVSGDILRIVVEGVPLAMKVNKIIHGDCHRVLYRPRRWP